MPDEPISQPTPQSEPQPLETTVMPASTPATPVATPSAPPKRGGRTLGLLIVVLIVVIAAAAAAYYFVKANKPAVSVKKDIPYLTYGFQDSSDMTPTYPVNPANSANAGQVNTQLFEGLVRYQDQIKVAPALATSWSNPNDTTWVFNLRQGVKFHSGRTMTAADVKYSLDYAVANQGAQNSSTLLALASSIDQVTVVNPYQVKITTNGPDAVLLNQITGLYILDSKAKLGDPNAGTGPYTVKPGSVKPNATTLDLVAFDNYWGGHVYTRAVHFQEDRTYDQLVADTANGKFDIAGDFTAQQLATVKAKVNYQPITIPDLGISYLELNLEKAGSPLATLAARQAMTSALNIPAVIKASGLNATPVSQVIPQILPGYDPSINVTPYDPAKAKQLLATVPNAAAPLSLYYGTGVDAQAAEVAKQLNAVGFNVKATGIDNFDAFLGQVASGQGDIFLLSYTTNTLDGLDMINNTVGGTPNYTSAELTTLTDQASSTIDPATRIATLQKIEQLVAKDIPTIGLYDSVRTWTLTKPYVTNINLPGGTDAGLYLYQVYQK